MTLAHTIMAMISAGALGLTIGLFVAIRIQLTATKKTLQMVDYLSGVTDALDGEFDG